MQKITPYIIYHFPLETALNDNAIVLLSGGRYYCVFWWYSIPLGDVYIEEYNGNIDELHQTILRSIEPVIEFYISNKQVVASYKQAFLGKDYSVFSTIMNELFSNYLHTNVPAKFDISVVICTRQRSKDLKLCLESLQEQIYIPGEIIVVDNAPLDDSTQNVVEQYKNVTYYRETRPGLDIARNAGAKQAKCEVVAYIDDDVLVHPLWSYRVWESFQDQGTDALTGLIIVQTLDAESEQIFEKFWGFNKGYCDKKFDSKFIYNSKIRPPVWDIGAGANMAFRRSVLEKAGYFDERLDVGASGGSGDSEMWYRVLITEHTICYNPRAVAYHQHRKEMPALHRQLFSYMKGFVAAALIQHAQNRSAGYKKYAYYELPKYYLLLLRMGFPAYSFRYQTLWSEIKGLMAGFTYYNKNKNLPRIK